MDTTETYVAMSDCAEVQGEWKKIWTGDFCCWKPARDIEVVNQDMLDEKEDADWDDYIWLPRQDQIQEMFKWGSVLIYPDFLPIKDYNSGRYMVIPLPDAEFYQTPTYASMEQLWLAFYMYENHDKTWDGEKWA